MGADISVYTENFLGNEDRRWIGVQDGMDTCRTITLDPTLFAPGHIINGQLPSGTVLGMVTATGKYGPYDPAALDGRQVAAGHLFSSTGFGSQRIRAVTAADLAAAKPVAAALYWEGVVKKSKLPTFVGVTTGILDAAAQADTALGNFIRYEA